jgi:hypothetical protein
MMKTKHAEYGEDGSGLSLDSNPPHSIRPARPSFPLKGRLLFCPMSAPHMVYRRSASWTHSACKSE